MEQQTRFPRTKKEKRPLWRGRLWWKIVVTALLTLLVGGGLFCLLLGKNGMALMEGYLLARYAFVETDADLDTATDKALDALVDGLGDRWSYYRSEEDYAALRQRRANNYVGVGVTVNYEHEEGLYVQAVTAGGPAESVGILPGDIITAVNGTSLSGDARYTGSDLISGEAGTEVELTLLGTDGARRTVTCKRKTLSTPSASGRMLQDGIGYVQLINFYSGAADSFRQAVDDLVTQGATGLVIDLRNNPGGYIAELTEILDYLLPEGEIFRQNPRWWFETVTKSDAACIDLPFVTIVNADSYSAAEIMAEELREFCSSPIVGVQTSGKGYSQVTFPLTNGGGMGLSVATYCTGQGNSLIGTGITPDCTVELADGEDTQLQAALALFE